jgi:hypothetical protein
MASHYREKLTTMMKRNAADRQAAREARDAERQVRQAAFRADAEHQAAVMESIREGQPAARAAEQAAKQERRQARAGPMQERVADRRALLDRPKPAGRRVVLASLGVMIRGDEVWTMAGLLKSLYAGPLAGATAEITTGGRVHRVGAAAGASLVLGPVGLLAGLGTKSKASAFVVFADGTLREKKLDGNAEVRRAQAAAVRFNVLARSAEASANPE